MKSAIIVLVATLALASASGIYGHGAAINVQHGDSAAIVAGPSGTVSRHGGFVGHAAPLAYAGHAGYLGHHAYAGLGHHAYAAPLTHHAYAAPLAHHGYAAPLAYAGHHGVVGHHAYAAHHEAPGVIATNHLGDSVVAGPSGSIETSNHHGSVLGHHGW